MQIHGMLQGYNAAVAKHYPNGKKGDYDTLTPTPLTMFDLLRLNCDGAIRDYLEAFHRSKAAAAAASSVAEVAEGVEQGSMLEEGSSESGSEGEGQSKAVDYRLGADGKPLPGR